MIETARPALLWAGALLALVPLLLHLLRPRERARRHLPTLRFLAPDDRRRIRVRRLPDERRLLALRMGLCLLLGASFAGLTWVGRSSGTGTIVVVDGGAGMAAAWAAAGAAARTLGGPGTPAPGEVGSPDNAPPAGGPTGAPPVGSTATQPRLVSLLVVRVDADGEPLVERYAPDALPDQEAWARLAPDPSAGEVRLAHLIRALRDEAGRTTAVDSLVGRIVTVPRWSSWGPGLVELREALWPARIELTEPGSTGETEPSPATGGSGTPGPGADGGPTGPSGSPPPVATPTSVSLQAPPELQDRLGEALLALGFSLAEGPARADARIHLRVGPENALGELWNPAPAPTPPPPLPAPAPDHEDAFLLMDGRVLTGAGAPPMGTPAEGAAVPLLRAGGRPAAAATTLGGRCEISLPLDGRAELLERGELLLLLDAVLHEACEFNGRAGAAEAWRQLLSDREGPGALETRPLRHAGAGFPLTRLLLALTILVALIETRRARSVETKRE